MMHFTTIWLLGVVVVLGPLAMFTYTEMSWQAFIMLYLIALDRQDLYALIEPAQKLPGLECKNYTSNNDFAALFFEKRNGLPPHLCRLHCHHR